MAYTLDRSRRYHHGNLRNALIHAGLDILATQGIQGLSLREVARRTGVSHAAPYRHFANKEALLAAIAEEGFGRLAAVTRATIACFPDDPRAQLGAAHEAYVRFALENPDQLRVMFSGLLTGPGRPDTLQAAAEAAFGLLVGIVETGQRAEVLREGDPVRLAVAAWTMMHGLAVILVEGQLSPLAVGAESPEHAAGVLAEILYAGVGVKGAG